MAEDFSKCERYILQPKKTEALLVLPSGKTKHEDNDFSIYDNAITKSSCSTHLGLFRATTLKETAEHNVNNNIQKARRAGYSFMSSGLHGVGGLNARSALHAIKMFVSPILMYGLEISLPNQGLLYKLELAQKRLNKQLFMLHINTPDVAIYLLSGLLPIEAMIHKSAIVTFNSVCLQKK
ncbi:hypothetical protein DPMN_191424 [Dreissena polymorpha]|uniref:Uncharacterized protein n=1 Tax=Dreissena polymorpha TaxID=45954 RepID=A0A9D3Y228_DREPO|nr:hypothetical protein DPMN_191424 [Dreissena polymorpha]